MRISCAGPVDYLWLIQCLKVIIKHTVKKSLPFQQRYSQDSKYRLVWNKTYFQVKSLEPCTKVSPPKYKGMGQLMRSWNLSQFFSLLHGRTNSFKLFPKLTRWIKTFGTDFEEKEYLIAELSRCTSVPENGFYPSKQCRP